MDTLKIKFIGIGNKARHGKDTLALELQQLLPHSAIFRWAHCLYVEVQNKWNDDREQFPLIVKGRNKDYFMLDELYNNMFDDPPQMPKYIKVKGEEIAGLDKWWKKNNLKTEYLGMDTKDPEILQIWGTNYKRKYFGNSYWIHYLLRFISMFHCYEYEYILIPDTRFQNELSTLKALNGIYINIQRNNFIAPDRDPYHISEIELDEVDADYRKVFNSGDIEGIKSWAKELSLIDFKDKGISRDELINPNIISKLGLKVKNK